MARGTAKFDDRILKKLRASKEVEGHLLSAAELARLLKTSKARVLAYERGESVPEPGRVLQIAQIFKVHPRELYQAQAGTPEQLKDLRCYAGLTAAQLAAQIGVSRTTYRDVELLAVLPARDDGTLPLRLAEALNLPLAMVHRALDQHPAAAARRVSIAEHLSRLFERAEVEHQSALVDADDAALLQIAKLLHRPASVVCRLVNYDLARYRDLLRRQAVAKVNLAYAQTPRVAQHQSKEMRGLTEEIKSRPFVVASTQLRFLAEAMSAQQWRTVISLMRPNPGRFSVEVFQDLQKQDVWDGLVARHFVELDITHSPPDFIGVRLTPRAWDTCLSQIRLYECLYPRVPVPRPLPRRPHERRSFRKSEQHHQLTTS
ncbi:helix-turn-helix domain-containing protein [Streptomyces sp. NPDC008125]|uniref:helix-turn-helix domain-containing protein n=1 Tax=Streptomyces sp. NPDC008125 TaxID=3364811 RepID=UPI0036E9CD53